MSNIRFTKKEKTELLDLYNMVLDDLWELWQTSSTKSIYILLDLDDSKNKWSFFINDEKIQLSRSLTFNHSEIYTLAVPAKKFGKTFLKKKNDAITEDMMYKFLKKYEFIREKMLEQLERVSAIKQEKQELFEGLKRKLEKTSTVEINLGPTNNQHNIEVTEENGKKIGIINFGNQSIKIITEGDITLVNKHDKQKIKKK